MVSVQLANMGVGKTRIAEAFDVNRSMIYKWMNVYEQRGIEGVVLLRKGPDSKLSESIKDYICVLCKKLQGLRTYKNAIIKEVKEAYGVEISREAIRRVMKEKLGTVEVEKCSEGREPGVTCPRG